jgi:hypothetical protein
VERQRSFTEYLDALEADPGAVTQIRDALRDDLSRFYGDSEEKVDKDVKTILSTNRRLTDGEIDKLCDDFVHNPPMLRLIADYCERLQIPHKRAAVLGARARSSGGYELAVFNLAADAVRLPCSPEVFRSCREALDSLIVKP